MADDSTDTPTDDSAAPEKSADGDGSGADTDAATDSPPDSGDSTPDTNAAANSALVDTVFSVVADDNRRYALYYLSDRGATDVERLATVVAGWTNANADPTAVVTPDERERVEIALHHVHLPRLEREGFVRYDREAGTVELADVPDLLDTVLARSLDQRRREAGPRASGDSDWHDSRTDDAP
ncbi:DUF7344 domain-containing protein [Halorussus salinus]|uniref:DUF7344 domain-containing protein n=1 Tax=Halorussus salinus TaxID=1364935 RepID=UPI001092FA40|nr:hypothetical protein [Halorussus salinus]